MSEDTSGFSFNSGAPGPQNEEIDAVEVSGEPVSRSEAKQLGLNFESGKDSREAKASTNIFRMDQLPKDIGDDLAVKMEKAWNHLKRNELEEALTLAQEVVWQYPALEAAKIIIARCFINRKEYEKALNILQAIAKTEMSAETMYYIGLCQSRLGKVKEAIASLNLSKASSTDALIRKRANDLLLHLQGEQALCPICGKKTLYDSMVEVGNRMICVNCANSMEKGEISDETALDDEQEDEDLFGTDTGKRRKRLRRPLTRTDILLRALFALILLVLGLIVLYTFFPAYYAMFHSLLPGWLPFLPSPQYAPPPQQRQAGIQAEAPRVIPTLVFTSPPLEIAIAGVELRHQLAIEGMRGREGVYSVKFSPEPAGPYTMDPGTGELVWTPAKEDSGKSFAIAFDAVFKTMRAREQTNTVKVSPGLSARKVGQWRKPIPGSLAHIIYENITGGSRPELILVSGLYWQGAATIINPAEDGEGSAIAEVDLAGRPVGAGIIVAGAEKWLAIADYWNSRLRYFVFRNGSLSEMATTITLPGKPLAADFCRDASISTVLCKRDADLQVLAYKQENQLNSRVLGTWTVSDEKIWRDIFAFPAEAENAAPTIVLLAGNVAESLMLGAEGEEGIQPLNVGSEGILLEAFQDREKKRLYLLVMENNLQKLITIDMGQVRPVATQMAAGDSPALSGLAAASLSGDGTTDVIFLSSSSVGASFGLPDGSRTAPAYWPLPSPPMLFGKPGVLPGENGNEIVYADTQGALWAIGLAK